MQIGGGEHGDFVRILCRGFATSSVNCAWRASQSLVLWLVQTALGSSFHCHTESHSPTSTNSCSDFVCESRFLVFAPRLRMCTKTALVRTRPLPSSVEHCTVSGHVGVDCVEICLEHAESML